MIFKSLLKNFGNVERYIVKCFVVQKHFTVKPNLLTKIYVLKNLFIELNVLVELFNNLGDTKQISPGSNWYIMNARGFPHNC